jgi:hypothetical protein
MTAEEFACFRRSFGERVIPANGGFWRQVRPCFYRPCCRIKNIRHNRSAAPAWLFLVDFNMLCRRRADEFIPEFFNL